MISLESLDTCPLCTGPHFNHYLTARDFTVTQEEFNIVQCKDCGFLFTNPRPPQKELGRYYESDEYISHTNKGNSLINTGYKIARRFTLDSKLRLIQKHSPPGRILDYGCGTGAFLQHCQKNQWQVQGVEPNEQAREIANDVTKNNVTDSVDNLNEQYDAITLWHVLEHISKLNETIEQLKKLLKQQGSMFIAVPNPASMDAREFEQYWAAYDVPRHLYHFTQKSMTQLMEKHDMIVSEVIPMKLDAFYVSLLSNKYRSGRSKMAKSFITGLLSNSYGNKTGEYSSLIYRVTRNA